MITFKDFKNALSIIPCFCEKENTSILETSEMYTAIYRPRFPERTASDMDLYVNRINGHVIVYANLEALIPTRLDFKDFYDFCDKFGK